MDTYLLFQEIMRAMNEKFTINPPVAVSSNIKKTGPYLLIIINYCLSQQVYFIDNVLNDLRR